MPKNPKHFPSVADRELHKQVDATDGGACLTGHSTNHDDRCSCTYRWQALQPPAKDRHARYKGVRPLTPKEREEIGGDEVGYIKTLQYLTNKGKEKAARQHKKEHFYPVAYSAQVRLPEKEMDWAVGGPSADFQATKKDKFRNGIKVPEGKNYHRDLWPYWNNAHHIVPKDLLNTEIAEVDNSDDRRLVRAGLLRAEYNVNHWINMIILPQDKAVARLLGLPRHLTLEGGSAVTDKKPKFDHVAYNLNVKSQLTKIIAAYERQVQKMREGKKVCDVMKKVTLAKRQLENLSKRCYRTIVQFGAKSPGEPLVDMPSLKAPKKKGTTP